MTLTDEVLVAALDTHAPWRPVARLPGLSAWQADDEMALWQALEAAAGGRLPPPFYGIVWPGAQALALAIKDAVVDVRGRRVADVGSGSGLAAAAAMMAGAASARALDRDPIAVRAARELARRHGLVIETVAADAIADPDVVADATVILAGDLIYSADQRPLLARAVDAWRRRATVVLADSGRPFFDPCGLPLVCEQRVDVAPAVDGAASRCVCVYRGGEASADP